MKIMGGNVVNCSFDFWGEIILLLDMLCKIRLRSWVTL